MMREIVVNGRFLSRRITGVERYGREILACIGDRCRLEMTRSQGLRGHAWEQWVLPRKLKPESVLWSPANTGPLSVQRQALTIHDLSALEHPEWFQRRFAFWYSLLVPMLVKRAGLLFVPSEYVKQKMIQRFQMHNVIVTPNGVNPSIFHPNARQHKYSLPARYVLFVGTLEPRKNLKALLQAWREMYKDFKDIWLVIAGSQGRVHRTAQPAGIHERVIFLGYVEEAALPGLYAGASLFVLPSLAEGFGLPALEAMACGVPVLVSNGGALPAEERSARCTAAKRTGTSPCFFMADDCRSDLEYVV
jgi:glycosyltransferase involved in cell wall biosynthesis